MASNLGTETPRTATAGEAASAPTGPTPASPVPGAKPDPAHASGKRVVVVIGPGRCGTSAITRCLTALGVDLGDKLKPAMRKNPRGFFEDMDLLDINYRLAVLLGLRKNGSSLRLLDDGEFDAPEIKQLEGETVDLVTRRFGHTALWGFKVGGVLRTLPFWERVFEQTGFQPSYLLAIRNPISVAKSRQRLDVFRGVQEKSDMEWLTQVAPYFRRTFSAPLAVVDFDDIMADAEPQVLRIARDLNLTPDTAAVRAYAESFLSTGFQHNRASHDALAEDPRVAPLTRDAYLWLGKMAADEITCNDKEFLADWSRIEAQTAALGPALAHIDRLETSLRRNWLTNANIWRAVRQHVPLSPKVLTAYLKRAFRRTASG